jgi:hypothetical protein
VYSSISEDSGDGDTQQDRADGATGTGMTTIMHSRLAVQAADRGGPLAELCDDLPGFEARDITALLSDLPIPIPGGVPGMTVEEAIEVWFCVYKDIYHCIYHGILHGIYHCIYHVQWYTSCNIPSCKYTLIFKVM